MKKLVEKLNIRAESGDFEIGKLQDLRKEIHNLQRKPRNTIFAPISINSEYAFHCGGRAELQFNIGLEEDEEEQTLIRHGVAFSLQESRTLPNFKELIPKIERFNNYVSSHLEDFPEFSMWKFHNGERSENRAIGVIGKDWIERNNFIMLGRLSKNGEEKVDQILADFDRLLPLYEYVERAETDDDVIEVSDFKPGCPKFVKEFTISKTDSKSTDIALRHITLQNLLYKILCEEAGDQNVQIERRLSSFARVDASTRCGEYECFFEIKVAPSVRSCLRAALGQLLEYAHLYSRIPVNKLIVVGEAEANDSEKEYLEYLRERYKLPIYYRRIDTQNGTLEAPI